MRLCSICQVQENAMRAHLFLGRKQLSLKLKGKQYLFAVNVKLVNIGFARKQKTTNFAKNAINCNCRKHIFPNFMDRWKDWMLLERRTNGMQGMIEALFIIIIAIYYILTLCWHYVGTMLALCQHYVGTMLAPFLMAVKSRLMVESGKGYNTTSWVLQLSVGPSSLELERSVEQLL